MRHVTCPTCGKQAPWDENNRWRPFCSERCRLIDLGAWFGENYRLPGDTREPAETPPTDDDRHRD